VFGHEGDFLISARLRLLNYEFSSRDITGMKVENFTDTKSTTCLEFQYQAISGVLDLKMISSTVSLSRILLGRCWASLNVFDNDAALQGLLMFKLVASII